MALEQIGQKLKAAREGQGLSLAQIYERTKIPINHLQSIDTGVIDDLPEPVYVAGFIKRYAECVGLNGQVLSDEYRKQATPERVGNGDSSWGARSNIAQPVLVSPPHIHRSRIEERPPSIFKSVLFPVCWIILIFVLITFLFNWQRNTDNAANQDSSLVPSASKFDKVQPTPATTAPTQGGPTVTAPVTATPPASTEAQVSLTASQHVWVDIKAVSTGESLYTGFLEAGDRRDFKDSQGVRVHAGNGGSITVENEGKSQTLGAAGKITEKAFLAKNANPAAVPADGNKPATATGTGTGTGTTTAVVKPVKRIKKPNPEAAAAAAARRRARAVEEPSRSIPGENVGGTRSIDVPYRYTEGRLDTND